jgi:hypothetical protein
VREEGGRLGEDGFRRGGETRERGKVGADGGEGVTDGIGKGGLGHTGTAEEVIAMSINGGATKARAGLDLRGDTGKTKAAEKGKAVEVGGKAVGSVLSGHAVKRDGHPGREKGVLVVDEAGWQEGR